MSNNSIMVEAVFEDGVFRPVKPLALTAPQAVTLIVQLPGAAQDWPADVAAIYREIDAEGLRLAEAMRPTLQETWPVHEE